MAVITDVINDALSEVGVPPISDPNEPSQQARTALALFPRVVRTEFRRHAWNFALTRTTLASTGVAPPWGFANAFNLPVGLLRLWSFNDVYVDALLDDYVNEDLSPFAIEGRQILTSFDAPLKIRYIQDMQSDITSWDSMFRDVVAVKLAAKLEPSVVKNTSRRQLLEQQYEKILRDAKRCNAIELPPVRQPDGSWMFGRI